MLDKLKRAGFNWLAFGIEAASDRVLSDVDKRYEIEQVYDTIARVKAAGINIIGNYIFGLPEDDLDSMQETLDLAMELKTEFANFYSAMAYPGRRCIGRRSPTAGRSRRPGAATRSTPWTRCPCRPSTCRRARFSSSATSVQRIFHAPVRTSTTSSAGSAPTRSRISARCRRTGSNASSQLPEPVERIARVYVAGADTLIGAAIITALRRDGYDVLDGAGEVELDQPRERQAVLRAPPAAARHRRRRTIGGHHRQPALPGRSDPRQPARRHARHPRGVAGRDAGG